MNIVNIAAYKFIALDANELLALQTTLKEKAQVCELKGTILLSAEGMNLMLAGARDNIRAFQQFLAEIPAFTDLTYKESLSEDWPFNRLIVRSKKEIIRMDCDEVQPVVEKADYVSPQTLQQWYEQQRDMVIIDTRNDYEVSLGTFEQALDLKLTTFSEFPQAIENLPEWMKEKPVVTFCTGGIRCEKAALLLRKKGFREVYQLEGGILNYFAQCGGEHFRGECFVFDNRVAVNPRLRETDTRLCKVCGNPLTVAQLDDHCCCRKAQITG
jgi:UPF0176 protein